MYLPYFGLAEPPFSITPDPRFVFLSARHEDALAHLRYGITQGGGGGFVQLTGEVGTGKTTLSRLLLSDLPDHADAALVLNPLLEPRELLATICEELGIDVSGAEESTKKLTDRLNRRLLEAHAAGRTVVAVIDEAQNLSPASLEQVRLLTNLETSSQKLLQIILLGQPELRDLLGRADLRQLAQRITARFHLTPLDAEETAAYVAHRLQVAGASRNPFTGRALDRLHRLTGGVPRLVNIVADRALLVAYAAGRRTVEPAMVARAATEVRGDEPRARTAGRRRLAFVVLAAMALVSAGAWWMVVDRAPAAVDPPATPATAVVEADPGMPEAAPTASQARPDEPSAASGPTAAVVEPASAPPVAPPEDRAEPWPAVPREEAFAALLEARAVEATVPRAAACPWTIGPGVACLEQRGRLRELAWLERPVLASTAEGWGVVTVDRTRVRWEGGTGTRNVPHAAFEQRWSGRYLDVWTMPGYVPEILREGDRGPAILWIKAAAAAAEPPFRGDAADPWFDPSLTRWTVEFQRRHGLDADGLIGRETLQRLSLHAPPELP